VARTVFKTAEAFARGLVGSIPTLSRHRTTLPLHEEQRKTNVLSPGPTAAPMQEQVLDEETKRMFASVIPRGKMGRPEEIAAAALFLASDDSSLVNGVEFSVDGGTSAI
jgi:NAD(P)-dependent dehydrogenase (short-subunit alcohol dehydrogenase family)